MSFPGPVGSGLHDTEDDGNRCTDHTGAVGMRSINERNRLCSRPTDHRKTEMPQELDEVEGPDELIEGDLDELADDDDLIAEDAIVLPDEDDDAEVVVVEDVDVDPVPELSLIHISE